MGDGGRRVRLERSVDRRKDVGALRSGAGRGRTEIREIAVSVGRAGRDARGEGSW